MVHEGNPEMPFTGHQLILRSRDRGKTWHLTYYERHINLLTDDALQYHIDSRVSEGKLPIKFGYFTCVYYLKILSGIKAVNGIHAIIGFLYYGTALGNCV